MDYGLPALIGKAAMKNKRKTKYKDILKVF